ncbi:hypothetical protein [Amycolatopsis jiangsuensis]|uniref:Uncharacterized protein n=1 Tax=Amycolatopsis jiangsuensis TaxID=1181879 RepID=A0A840ITG9_9PSEU|nr:hypothetical protein [Amycolatopsis jiangsuensis]MBB4685746.1 hypothetical protein [Amycolatopsis jiangsuensis]
MTRRSWRIVLSGLAIVYLALGGWAAVDASSFGTVVAPFGAANPHLVRDFAACAATFGLGLLIASRRYTWRTPALTLAAIWNGAHAVIHIVDITEAHPFFVGPLEAALLVFASALFTTLALLSARGGSRDHRPQ